MLWWCDVGKNNIFRVGLYLRFTCNNNNKKNVVMFNRFVKHILFVFFGLHTQKMNWPHTNKQSHIMKLLLLTNAVRFYVCTLKVYCVRWWSIVSQPRCMFLLCVKMCCHNVLKKNALKYFAPLDDFF